MSGENNFSIEESLKKIEDLVSELKKEDTTLEEAFSLYEKGIVEVKRCNEELAKLEKKIVVIDEEENGI